jgi:hypothetical protein
MAHWTRAIDMIRDRFGWDAIDTDQLCWGYPVLFLMSFASSPKRSCKPLPVANSPCGFFDHTSSLGQLYI